MISDSEPVLNYPFKFSALLRIPTNGFMKDWSLPDIWFMYFMTPRQTGWAKGSIERTTANQFLSAELRKTNSKGNECRRFAGTHSKSYPARAQLQLCDTGNWASCRVPWKCYVTFTIKDPRQKPRSHILSILGWGIINLSQLPTSLASPCDVK